MITYAIGNFEK